MHERRDRKKKCVMKDHKCMLILENRKNIHLVMATVFRGRNPMNKTPR